MRRRKKSVTINFFSIMSEISEETEELLLAEDRISERSSTSNCSKEAEKEKQTSEKVNHESDTAESELSSDESSTSSASTEKRKYSQKDVLEESSANPLIDKPEAANDPLAGMEMDHFEMDFSESCPAPCDASNPAPCDASNPAPCDASSPAPCDASKRFEVLVNCTMASDQLGLSGTYNLHVRPVSLDLEDCDTMKTVHSWKYDHIKRFGYKKSTNDFLMVVGRRNKFGNGVFEFHVMGDPRQIIDSLQNKPGCSLRLLDSAKRISSRI